MPKLCSLFFAGSLGVFSFAEAQIAVATPTSEKPKEPPGLTLLSNLNPGWCGTVDGPTSF